MKTEAQWRESGAAKMSDKQRRLFNAACNDLAEQMNWHGHHLSKDDWRHLFTGIVLGNRPLPGWDYGDGQRSTVMLGRSSLELTKTQATDAITMAFFLGDFPHEQGMSAKPVRWCAVVCCARWITDEAAA